MAGELQGPMPVPAIEGFTPQLMQEMFAAAPAGDNLAWVGDSLVVIDPPHMEVIPFQFRAERYVCMFHQPIRYLGGDPVWLEAWAEVQADGFMPAEHSRVVKFCRAEAQDGIFNPNHWGLVNTSDIFQFAGVLADVVAVHETLAEPRVQQYFFQPSSKGLKTLYRRAFKVLDRDLLPNTFTLILDATGEYIGYERVPA